MTFFSLIPPETSSSFLPLLIVTIDFIFSGEKLSNKTLVTKLLSTTSSGYYPPFINISQSWSEVVQTPSGSLVKIHDNLEEFYNGEFEGTTIIATTQSLIDGDCQQFLDVNTTEVQYKPILYLYNGSAPISQSVFLSSNVTPSAGEILLYFISEQVEQGSPDGQQSQRPNQSQNTQ
jgi:hypothetical protein